MFLRIQGGDYVINLNHISGIEFEDGYIDVTLSNGTTYTVEDPKEIKAIRKHVNI